MVQTIMLHLNSWKCFDLGMGNLGGEGVGMDDGDEIMSRKPGILSPLSSTLKVYPHLLVHDGNQTLKSCQIHVINICAWIFENVLEVRMRYTSRILVKVRSMRWGFRTFPHPWCWTYNTDRITSLNYTQHYKKIEHGIAEWCRRTLASAQTTLEFWVGSSCVSTFLTLNHTTRK